MAKIYDYAIQEAKVTSDFGWRTHPITGKKSHHDGVDLISGTGNRNLFGIEDGYVQLTVTNQSNAKSGYGNRIWIRYPRIDRSVMYAHCEKILKKKGDTMKKGDIVAIEGKTGAATGVHLHFGMTKIGSDEWLNPQTYDYQPPNVVTPDVKRDENKDQIKVVTTQLRVRKNHDTKSDILGVAKENGIYNYYETFKDDKYTWYRIADGQWVANDGEWLEVYPKKESEDKKVIEELKKQLEEANAQINQLTARVEELELINSNLNTLNQALQEENKKLLEGIDSFNKIYTCTKTGNYNIKVKLYENESLYVK